MVDCPRTNSWHVTAIFSYPYCSFKLNFNCPKSKIAILELLTHVPCMWDMFLFFKLILSSWSAMFNFQIFISCTTHLRSIIFFLGCSKSSIFGEKMWKTICRFTWPLWGEGDVWWQKINVIFFVGYEASNIFHLTIFSKKKTFSKITFFGKYCRTRLLPFYIFLEAENVIMRSILYEKCRVKKLEVHGFTI